MANTKKMTNKTALEIALALVLESAHPEKAEVAEKLTKQIESIAKKNSKTSGKLTPKQIANLEIGESVVQYLRENPTQMFSIAELLKNVPNMPEDMSSQRLTAVFRQDNVRPYYRRDTVKGKSYFQYCESVEEEVEE